MVGINAGQIVYHNGRILGKIVYHTEQGYHYEAIVKRYDSEQLRLIADHLDELNDDKGSIIWLGLDKLGIDESKVYRGENCD